jgi:hypothetical protein
MTNQELFDQVMDVCLVDRAECLRLQVVARSRCDISMNLAQAHDIWQSYSDARCASWLIMDSYNDDDLVDAIWEVVRRRAGREDQQ